jgi:hypothetical protein
MAGDAQIACRGAHDRIGDRLVEHCASIESQVANATAILFGWAHCIAGDDVLADGVFGEDSSAM